MQVDNPFDVQQHVAAIVDIVKARAGTGRIEDDPTMRITRTERERALEIKEAVEADHRLTNLSDFEYAQYALSTGEESLERIRERVYIIQCFRDEYRLGDTIEEGILFFDQFEQFFDAMTIH